ncbi:MAG: thioredoxin family protein [Chlamydiota bacterium]
MRIILGFFVSVNVFLSAAVWNENYEEALVSSKESNKPLVLAFLEKEGCPWSQKLYAEVLSQPQFLEDLDPFILVKIELSQMGSSFFKEKYQIQEVPSLIVLSSLGEEMARVGYMPLKPSEYAEFFTEIKSNYEEISGSDLRTLSGEKLQELYMTALKYGFNDYRYEILSVGLQRDKTPFFLLEKYKLLIENGKFKGREALDVRKELIKRDPKNDYGVHRTLAIVDFHKLSNRYRLRKKPDEVAAPLVDYVKKFGAGDQEHLWKIEMMIAQFYFGRDRVQTAIAHAERSYQVAPDLANEEIAQSIEFLKSKS